MDQQTYALAETIWDYHLMKHQVAKADAILVLCSHDERVAEEASDCFTQVGRRCSFSPVDGERSLKRCGTNRRRNDSRASL